MTLDTLTKKTALLLGALLLLIASAFEVCADTTLLNVSYDPTRELYEAVNKAFAADWKAKTGETVNIRQSHGGSGKQARAVVDGLAADVVTLALAADIDQIAALDRQAADQLAEASARQQLALHLDDQSRRPQGQSQGHQGLGRSGEAGRLRHHAEPEDLGRRALELPRRLGLCRREVRRRRGKDRANSSASSTRTCRCSTPARAARRRPSRSVVSATCSSAGKTKLISILKQFPGEFEIVTPSISILAEPPVALVDGNADNNGTRKVAEAYLKFLYTPDAQKIIAANFYRPRDPSAADPKDIARFPKIELVTIDGKFGGWRKAQKLYFGDGGIFDQIYRP